LTLLLDNREGSWQLARLEPIRSLLPPCIFCGGTGKVTRVGQIMDPCPTCRGTGRQLSRITTSQGEGGPDVLIAGQGPNGPVLVAVEIKELRELIQATDTGRLQAPGEGQLPAMLADYDQSWLLWHGTVRCGDSGVLEEPRGRGDNGRCLWGPFAKNPSGRGAGSGAGNADSGAGPARGLPCSYLDGLLLAVARMGVHVHHVPNEREAARWLGVLYDSWTKPWDEHRFTRTFKDVTRFPQVIAGTTEEQIARARRIADRYPGLGVERALAAARYFGSVQEMANADEATWMKVPGVGKVIAAAVVKGFRA
jgi:Helix-hairpin-helix domain